MIELKRKQECCGCTACVSICPQHCITMLEDGEGFLYPSIDKNACISCNACNKVCPVLKAKKRQHTSFSPETFAFAAAINDEDVLIKSSSGGLFSAISTLIIKNKGVVYGAAWLNDEVHHVGIETIDDLAKLRGSKYVQSSIDDSFLKVRDYLREGRKVLFSGTPCQIAGLRAFLRKDYDNLFTIEVACHGAPSPKVLRKYVQLLKDQYGPNVKIDFRSKPEGWQHYKVTAYTGSKHHFYEGQKENLFMKGFLRELYSRPICHECPFKAGVSGADITLADFWGIQDTLASFPSYNGASLVLAHSNKSKDVLKMLKGVTVEQVDLTKALSYNAALIHSEQPHPEREYFFRNLDKESLTTLTNNCLNIRLVTRLRLRIQSYINIFIR